MWGMWGPPDNLASVGGESAVSRECGYGGRQKPDAGEPTSRSKVLFKFGNEMLPQIELHP